MKKLNLGRELSKNQQKKILGGITIICSNGDVIQTQVNPGCGPSGQSGYCPATGRGYTVACYNYG